MVKRKSRQRRKRSPSPIRSSFRSYSASPSPTFGGTVCLEDRDGLCFSCENPQQIQECKQLYHSYKNAETLEQEIEQRMMFIITCMSNCTDTGHLYYLQLLIEEYAENNDATVYIQQFNNIVDNILVKEKLPCSKEDDCIESYKFILEYFNYDLQQSLQYINQLNISYGTGSQTKIIKKQMKNKLRQVFYSQAQPEDQLMIDQDMDAMSSPEIFVESEDDEKEPSSPIHLISSLTEEEELGKLFENICIEKFQATFRESKIDYSQFQILERECLKVAQYINTKQEYIAVSIVADREKLSSETTITATSNLLFMLIYIKIILSYFNLLNEKYQCNFSNEQTVELFNQQIAKLESFLLFIFPKIRHNIDPNTRKMAYNHMQLNKIFNALIQDRNIAKVEQYIQTYFGRLIISQQLRVIEILLTNMKLHYENGKEFMKMYRKSKVQHEFDSVFDLLEKDEAFIFHKIFK